MSKKSMPKFFKESVLFLKERGFKIEPGPGKDEVTLMIEENGGMRSYSVYEKAVLPSLVKEILHHSRRTLH